jgi:hypothetical protein
MPYIVKSAVNRFLRMGIGQIKPPVYVKALAKENCAVIVPNGMLTVNVGIAGTTHAANVSPGLSGIKKTPVKGVNQTQRIRSR